MKIPSKRIYVMMTSYLTYIVQMFFSLFHLFIFSFLIYVIFFLESFLPKFHILHSIFPHTLLLFFQTRNKYIKLLFRLFSLINQPYY